MIRTHKPRGHIWTNASAFQQTKGYRDIDWEECQSLPGKVFALGSNEDLTSSERAAKRRRIEKLAGDFLDGKPLVIGRPCPNALENTIFWNKKSSDDPKFVFPNVQRPPESDALWEHVEDEDSFLARMTAKHGDVTVGLEEDEEASAGCEIEVEDEQAQASYGRARQARPWKLSTTPSQEALMKAAELWQRRLGQVAIGTQSEPRPAIKAVLSPIVQSQPGGDAAQPSTAVDVGEEEDRVKWLSKRHSHAFDVVDLDESLDELRLSRLETPSRQLKRLNEMRLKEKTLEVIDTSSAQVDDRCLQVSEMATHRENSSFESASQGDPPRSQGTRISQTIWPPTDPPGEPAPTCATSGQLSLESATDAQALSTNKQPTRQDSQKRLSAAFKTPKQAQLLPASTDRQPRFAGPRNYTKENAKDGATPFMFRKLRSSGRHAKLQACKVLDAPQSSPVRKTTNVSPNMQGSRCASEPRALTSQAQDVNSSNLEGMEKKSSTQFWPGTQVLLCQAQRDLFTSPEKQKTVHEPAQPSPTASQTTPQQHPGRKRLKQLSQEPMPSTQQLLENFEGFSTVKKPRGSYRGSPVPTPTANNRNGKLGKTEDTTLSIAAPGKNERRSSGLRNSTTSLNTSGRSFQCTPPPTNDVQQQPYSNQSFVPRQNSIGLSTRALGSAAPPSLNFSFADESLPTNPLALRRTDSTTDMFTSAPDVPCHRHAQRESSMMNEGMLDRTIEDLTKEVLQMPEMEAVFSQS